MRLILFDRLTPKRINFYPLALSRPVFELRCGMTSLADKLIAKLAAGDVACFVPPYMADGVSGADQPAGQRPGHAPRRRPAAGKRPGEGGRVRPVADRARARWPRTPTARSFTPASPRPTWANCRPARSTPCSDSAQELLPAAKDAPAAWNYTWDLVLANPAQLAADFAAAGRSGIEGADRGAVAPSAAAARTSTSPPARSCIRWW